MNIVKNKENLKYEFGMWKHQALMSSKHVHCVPELLLLSRNILSLGLRRELKCQISTDKLNVRISTLKEAKVPNISI